MPFKKIFTDVLHPNFISDSFRFSFRLLESAENIVLGGFWKRNSEETLIINRIPSPLPQSIMRHSEDIVIDFRAIREIPSWKELQRNRKKNPARILKNSPPPSSLQELVSDWAWKILNVRHFFLSCSGHIWPAFTNWFRGSCTPYPRPPLLVGVTGSWGGRKKFISMTYRYTTHEDSKKNEPHFNNGIEKWRWISRAWNFQQRNRIDISLKWIHLNRFCVNSVASVSFF